VGRLLGTLFCWLGYGTFCGFLAYRGASLADFDFVVRLFLLAIAIPHVNLDVPAEE
jgi:hypothetical protein